VQVIKKKLPLSVETCAHYLTFAAESIPDGDTRYKCAPPLRDAANRAALLAAVKSGDIDIISSDHSPAPPSMKETESGDFLKAWGGISGIVGAGGWGGVGEVGVGWVGGNLRRRPPSSRVRGLTHILERHLVARGSSMCWVLQEG
jgi:hypothetical protein